VLRRAQPGVYTTTSGSLVPLSEEDMGRWLKGGELFTRNVIVCYKKGSDWSL
jgi:hypothetical protein